MSCPQKIPVRSREKASLVPVTSRLKPERVQLLLKKLPQWRQSRDGKFLSRTFRFADPGVRLAFAGFVAALAAEESHFTAVSLHQETVVCKLTTAGAGGLTSKDFDMARRISLLA
jgi:pterin-4a-carbinolamine dehydratase